MKFQSTLINVITLIALFAGIIWVSSASPIKRGFWCSDESIRYPRQPDTVGVGQLALIVLVLPLIVLVAGELIAFHCNLNSSSIKSLRKQANISSSKSPDIPIPWSINIKPLILCLLYNVFVTALLTGFIKTRTGRLRPVFYQMCQSSVSCDESKYQSLYITDFTCDISPAEEIFIRTSFPSGHASYSICSMIFLIIYLGQRFNANTRWYSLRYQIAYLQIVFLIIALYVGLSRVSDNIHHWSDVLAGFILGAAVTIVCTYFLNPLENPIEDTNNKRSSYENDYLSGVGSDHQQLASL